VNGHGHVIEPNAHVEGLKVTFDLVSFAALPTEASEKLVTNAVTHAPYGPITLSLRPARGRPLIEVRDCSAVLPVLKPADYVAESGRGLHIVEALSLEYGWERTRSGKTVWAILA
jgi:anti-sigma regulatory factor (Ser/Thr protein kinase)